MLYDSIPELSGLKYVHENKIAQLQHIPSDSKKPLVIFLDGKNATKGHKYQMSGDKAFAKILMTATRTVLRDYKQEYALYATMDEITCVFPNATSVSVFFQEDTVMTLASLFAVLVSKEFSKTRPCDFKAVAYFGTSVDDEIKFRKVAGRATAMEYFAKENLKTADYAYKGYNALIDVFKAKDVWDKFNADKILSQGIEFRFREKPPDIPYFSHGRLM